MSSIINNIKWTLYNGLIPRDRLPIIETSSDSAAYGTVTIAIPAITTVSSVSCSVYLCLPPTTGVDNWTRLAPDLWTSDVCNFSYVIDADNNVVITWEFDPSSSPLSNYVLDGSFFSVEFSVNSGSSATVPQIKANSIIKIVDMISDTGLTGFAGITGLRSKSKC
jgi:hypothetical protein